MNLPTISPPTDSLYKFISISGVLFMIFGIAYPSYANSTEIEKIWKYDHDNWDRETQIHLQITALLYKSEAKKLVDLLVETEGKIIEENKIRSKEMRDKASGQIATVRWQSQVMIACGIMFTVWGFASWYNCIQKHQDRLLKVQIEETEAKVAEVKLTLAKSEEKPSIIV